LAGNLDAITPIITMFFLLMYATINVSCFAVAFLGTPGFRPTWRCFHWSSALLGCLLCLGLMFAISWLYSLVALAFGAGVGFYVRSRRVSTDWGDAGAGFRFQVARDQLLALTERSTFHHAKNWRPQILVLCRFHAASSVTLNLMQCRDAVAAMASSRERLRAGATAASTPSSPSCWLWPVC
jgi:potassium/chloride transporter 4/5/6